MSDDNSNNGGECGCGGCVMLVVFILMFWAIFFGLPINDKKWNIDIFPPRIWVMNASTQVRETPPAPTPAPADVPAPIPDPIEEADNKNW